MSKYIPPYKLRMMQENNAVIDARIEDISSKTATLKRASANMRTNKYVPPLFSGGDMMPVQDCKYGQKCPFGLSCKFNHSKKQKQKFAEVIQDQPTAAVRSMKQQEIDNVRSQTYCKYGVNCTFAFECKFGHTEEERAVWEGARQKQEEEEARAAAVWGKDETPAEPVSCCDEPLHHTSDKVIAAPVFVAKKIQRKLSVPVAPVAIVSDDLLFQIKMAFVVMFGLCMSVIIGQLSAASHFDVGFVIGLAVAIPAFVYATAGWWNFQKQVPMVDAIGTTTKTVVNE